MAASETKPVLNNKSKEGSGYIKKLRSLRLTFKMSYKIALH